MSFPDQSLRLPRFRTLVLANQWPEIITMCLVCWENVVLCGPAHILGLVNGTGVFDLEPLEIPRREHQTLLDIPESEKKQPSGLQDPTVSWRVWRVALGFKKWNKQKDRLVGQSAGWLVGWLVGWFEQLEHSTLRCRAQGLTKPDLIARCQDADEE